MVARNSKYTSNKTTSVRLLLRKCTCIRHAGWRGWIEQRAAAEVAEPFGARVAPRGVGVYNPAFDVTPHELVTAVITEKGIAHPPFEPTLRKWADENAPA